mmetsp:Transcript_20871/g.48759  ORF Transcript_20871/g.48759 Transcript_20871/m.48759 type:complete len:225 (+) Transcript_20871:316-990(+)
MRSMNLPVSWARVTCSAFHCCSTVRSLVSASERTLVVSARASAAFFSEFVKLRSSALSSALSWVLASLRGTRDFSVSLILASAAVSWRSNAVTRSLAEARMRSASAFPSDNACSAVACCCLDDLSSFSSLVSCVRSSAILASAAGSLSPALCRELVRAWRNAVSASCSRSSNFRIASACALSCCASVSPAAARDSSSCFTCICRRAIASAPFASPCDLATAASV